MQQNKRNFSVNHGSCVQANRTSKDKTKFRCTAALKHTETTIISINEKNITLSLMSLTYIQPAR